MKKVLLMMLLTAGSVCAFAQTNYGDATNGFTVTKDANTLTITGHGNMFGIKGNNENYTFTYSSYEKVYEGDSHTPVSYGTAYDFGKTYYFKTPNYIKATSEPQTKEVWKLKNDKTLYTLDNSNLIKWNNGNELNFSNNYQEITSSTEAVENTDYTVKDVAIYSFNSDATDKIFTKEGSNSDPIYTQATGNYSSSVEYYLKDNDNYTPINFESLKSNNYLEITGGWGFAASNNKIFTLNEWNQPDNWAYGEYDPAKTYYLATYEGNMWGGSTEIAKDALISQGHLLTEVIIITPGTNLYTLGNGNYTNISNEVYFDKSSIELYKVIYEQKADNAIKDDSYSDHSTQITNTGGKYYTYNGSSYVQASDNDIYKAKVDDVSQYYTYTGDSYTEATFSQLNQQVPGAYENYIKLADGSTTLWQDIVAGSNTDGIKTVILNSADTDHPATIDNSVVHALMAGQMRVLDLSEVYIEEIASPAYRIENGVAKYDYNKNGTFCQESDNTAIGNSYIETLYTPQVAPGSTLYNNTFGLLTKLRYLHISEGVETLAENSVEGTTKGMQLSVLTFPNSLKYIKERACSGHYAMGQVLKDLDDKVIPYIETLVFPAGLLEIKTNAFKDPQGTGTAPKDVFFLGLDAPVVEKHAFGDDAYISNNAFTPSVTVGNETVNVAETGIASRYNYTCQSGWIAMLHYPAECSEAQAAKYTDLTRDYRKLNLVQQGEEAIHYCPGSETSPITGNGNATSNAAVNDFMSTNATYHEGDYQGGYSSYILDDQYNWPSISMAYRATVVAQNNLTWDGVTTIGEQIRQYDSSYEGTGEEYRGLHQFVLAAPDSKQGDTKIWDLDKFSDGEWHSICVPFNMTKAQMKETFGKHHYDTNGDPVYIIRVCKFSDVVRNDDRLTLKFNDEIFTSANDDDIVIKAHYSYMIKADKSELVDDDAPTFKFRGYQMQPGSPIVSTITSTGDGEHLNYRFVGGYMAGTTIPQYSYYFSKKEKKFKFQTGTTAKWSPYSAIVLVPEGIKDNVAYFNGSNTEAGAKIITRLADEDYETESTGVNAVTIESDGEIIYTNDAVYSLSGKKVGNCIENLAKGIYIVNGKKYLIK